MMMSNNARTAILAIATSILTTVIFNGAMEKMKHKERIYVSPLSRSALNPSARSAQANWGEMQQAEVDKLTSLLKAIDPAQKESVVVFCGDNSTCGDLALDLENAFESAHWTINTERPVFDNSVGLTSNSEQIAFAMDIATGGRLKPNLIDRKPRLGCAGATPIAGVDCSKPRETVYISLGRKPK